MALIDDEGSSYLVSKVSIYLGRVGDNKVFVERSPLFSEEGESKDMIRGSLNTHTFFTKYS